MKLINPLYIKKFRQISFISWQNSVYKYILILIFSTSYALSNSLADSLSQLLIKKIPQSPYQFFTGDSLNIYSSSKDIVQPGDNKMHYSIEQDSAFARALRLKITTSSRLNMDFRLNPDEYFNGYEKDTSRNVIARRNLNISDNLFIPLSTEMVQRQLTIMNAFNVPHVNTYNPYGLKISMQSIGRFLGLLPDLSPVLEYNIDFTAEVEVVIYSVQAVVISTLFRGMQNPGNYRYVWNGRDQVGKPMPSGDYIGEIRIGKVKYIRKRIFI